MKLFLAVLVFPIFAHAGVLADEYDSQKYAQDQKKAQSLEIQYKKEALDSAVCGLSAHNLKPNMICDSAGACIPEFEVTFSNDLIGSFTFRTTDGHLLQDRNTPPLLASRLSHLTT